MSSKPIAPPPLFRAFGEIHESGVLVRRQRVIAESIAKTIRITCRTGTSLLDVGCGNGEISWHLQTCIPSLTTIQGVELLPRPAASIPVAMFDGKKLPFETNSYDFVIMCDVLHHIADDDIKVVLMRECARVASQVFVLKDHGCDSRVDRFLLSAMDWIGNQSHGVPLPNSYPSSVQWADFFGKADLIRLARIDAPLGIYNWPISIVADRRPLHFIDAFVSRKND